MSHVFRFLYAFFHFPSLSSQASTFSVTHLMMMQTIFLIIMYKWNCLWSQVWAEGIRQKCFAKIISIWKFVLPLFCLLFIQEVWLLPFASASLCLVFLLSLINSKNCIRWEWEKGEKRWGRGTERRRARATIVVARQIVEFSLIPTKFHA